jgi:hypothetical protein
MRGTGTIEAIYATACPLHRKIDYLGKTGLHNEIKSGPPRSTSEEQIAAGEHGAATQAAGQDVLVATRRGR